MKPNDILQRHCANCREGGEGGGLTIYSIYIRPSQLPEEFLFWPPAEIKRWEFFFIRQPKSGRIYYYYCCAAVRRQKHNSSAQLDHFVFCFCARLSHGVAVQEANFHHPTKGPRLSRAAFLSFFLSFRKTKKRRRRAFEK